MGVYHYWHEYSWQFYCDFDTLGRTAKMRFVQWHDPYDRLAQGEGYIPHIVHKEYRNAKYSDIPPECDWILLIEIQYCSGIIYLNAIIKVMDDMWFLGFVDIVVPSDGATKYCMHTRGWH